MPLSADWAARIDKQLQPLLDAHRRAIDVAPALRHRLEGYLRAAIDAGVDAAALLQHCRQALPAGASIAFAVDDGSFAVELPQARAPVYPSTRD